MYVLSLRHGFLSIPEVLLVVLATACNELPPQGPGSGGDIELDTSAGDDPGTGVSDSLDATSLNEEGDPVEGPPPFCGDGLLTRDEACDDGNTESGDGCSGDCLAVTPGYSCNPPGMPCHNVARCGDGLRTEPELCDDGNADLGDGCSDLCKVEIGYKCEGDNPSACTTTTCGDTLVEGAESCDDGNDVPLDGCDERCQREPVCAVGAGCTSECGDGLVLSEACDDGNATSGDGCDAACAQEVGFTCQQSQACELIGGACVLRVNVIYRDFSAAHPDFQPNLQPNTLTYTCSTDGTREGNDPNDPYPADLKATRGIVAPTLDADGKPVLDSTVCAQEANFNQWYRDIPGVNTTIRDTLVLFPNGDGGYVNRFGVAGEQFVFRTSQQVTGNINDCTPAQMCTPCDNNPLAGCFVNETIYDGTPLFFPIDDVGTEFAPARVPEQYGYNGWPLEEDVLGTATPRNFHFTSEIAYWFIYDPAIPSTLEFTGDDDVWVFVNGILAVDLGGIHVPINGAITLDETTAPQFMLSAGNAYEVKVFHAERQTEGSSFRLTLTGFNTSRSECRPQCGDGEPKLGEECDDGINDGGYGECGANCKLDQYCGDGIIQREFGENCDDGNFFDDDDCPASCRMIIIG